MIEKISLPTISGLMLPQSIKIVRLFVECNNWAEVKAKAILLLYNMSHSTWTMA